MIRQVLVVLALALVAAIPARADEIEELNAKLSKLEPSIDAARSSLERARSSGASADIIARKQRSYDHLVSMRTSLQQQIAKSSGASSAATRDAKQAKAQRRNDESRSTRLALEQREHDRRQAAEIRQAEQERSAQMRALQAEIQLLRQQQAENAQLQQEQIEASRAARRAAKNAQGAAIASGILGLFGRR